jgi:hypothetical protein
MTETATGAPLISILKTKAEDKKRPKAQALQRVNAFGAVSDVTSNYLSPSILFKF